MSMENKTRAFGLVMFIALIAISALSTPSPKRMDTHQGTIDNHGTLRIQSQEPLQR